ARLTSAGGSGRRCGSRRRTCARGSPSPCALHLQARTVYGTNSTEPEKAPYTIAVTRVALRDPQDHLPPAGDSPDQPLQRLRFRLAKIDPGKRPQEVRHVRL